jgi:hypothetical protein
MRPKILVWAAIATACLLATCMLPLRAPWGLTLVQAQSLADVARAEEARRKQIKQPAKVYTNKDLVSVPPPALPRPTEAADTNAGTRQPASKDEKPEADSAATDTTSDTPKSKPRDQVYWSGRMKDLLTQLDRDRILADALESRINGLTADFSARDDPAQRTVIALDRQKALDELDRLKKSLLSDEKAIADFEEEARRASVPPGWLR